MFWLIWNYIRNIGQWNVIRQLQLNLETNQDVEFSRRIIT